MSPTTPDLAELRRIYEEAMRVGSNEMAWDEWTTAISEAAEDLFDAAAIAARAWDEGGDFVTRHPGMSAEYVRAANPYRHPSRAPKD